MLWPSSAKIAEIVGAVPGLNVSVMKSTEVEVLIESLKKWYPDVEIGMESVHLESEFYFSQCFLEDRENTRNNPIIPIVVKKGDAIVAFVSFQAERRAKTITSRLGVVNPESRGEKIGHLGPVILEGLGKQMNAGLVFYQATLKIPHQQIIAEKLGFKLVGILPAIDLDQVSPGKAMRVYEAIYAKVIASENEVMLPEMEALTPKTNQLFKFLFEQF